MSINQRIITALEGFGFPVVPDVYTGDQNTYFTFNYNTLPSDFADDCPRMERYLIQVHFSAPAAVNTTALQKQIKKQLFTAGEAWPEMQNASDAEGQHYVFECEWAEGVELNGET